MGQRGRCLPIPPGSDDLLIQRPNRTASIVSERDLEVEGELITRLRALMAK